jgi:hypothetical protein
MIIDTYLSMYDLAKSPNRKKRKRANMYDPNANHSDIDYMEHYGL